MRIQRRTKIVATLGPATDHPDQLRQLIQAGVNVCRLNFSHGSAEDHRQRATLARQIAEEEGRTIALLGDLQGPKIRIARFAEGAIELKPGALFLIDTALPSEAGNTNQVGSDYQRLAEQVTHGDQLLLDDGRIELVVEQVVGTAVHCRVLTGGRLSNNKGINKRGGGLSAPALTDKDKRDIELCAELGLDYVAVSFPQSADDLLYARQLLAHAGSQAGIVAKIERAEAIAEAEHLDAMILASDAIMVARGDLGVEIGDAELIGVQKRLIKRARQLDRAVITATQMMESMIHEPVPTRAEVFDIANAVLDGTDAVMLSAETATGQYPIKAVEAMARTCLGAEKHPLTRTSSHRVDRSFARVDEMIAMAAVYAANHLHDVAAIVCLTESGASALWASRLSTGLPIYALSRHAHTRRRTCLYRGVTPIPFDPTGLDQEHAYRQAIHALRQAQLVHPGERLIITHGGWSDLGGSSNTLRILEVSE